MPDVVSFPLYQQLQPQVAFTLSYQMAYCWGLGCYLSGHYHYEFQNNHHVVNHCTEAKVTLSSTIIQMITLSLLVKFNGS